MSLNFREIDLVLSELRLSGTRIQKIFQPSYDTIILETFGTEEGRKDLLISVASGACRIHGLSRMPAKNERPLRFMECLKSRIRGGRIESAVQLASDRIVKITISMPMEVDEEGLDIKPVDLGRTSNGIPRAASNSYTLYARLWSGASGNIILVDDNNLIVDALFRKPEKGESSGLPCRLEETLTVPDPDQVAQKAAKFQIRELEGEGSFSERVEAHYSGSAGELSRDNLITRATEKHDKRAALLAAKEAELGLLLEDYEDAERYRQIGDILMAGGFEYPATGRKASGKHGFIQTHDFYANKVISIQIDPSLSSVENAQKYYERFRKAISGLDDIKAELAKVKQAREELHAWIEALKTEPDPFAIARALEKAGTVREKSIKKYPCIWLEYKGWTMLVGRSAKENDELLRHHVRGSDLWLHARDFSGSYVFVKAQRSKTFPLDIMLDAANLAIYYSKARKNMEGNVYYTQAKHLRRVKDGPKGLVIPNLEKNLFVRLDEIRIKELLACSSGGES
ncbi:MAG TPA: fibronectin-binding domain-containing protein [Spirochaetaceae bacterium]|nr:fibronectin-binding domain-containing protein [Spirochaetaceae bacterium]